MARILVFFVAKAPHLSLLLREELVFVWVLPGIERQPASVASVTAHELEMESCPIGWMGVLVELGEWASVRESKHNYISKQMYLFLSHIIFSLLKAGWD